MDPSTFRSELSAVLVRFAWDEWSQMGVFAASERMSVWTQDPEALILLTLEVGRDDARLFDEMLDWILTNESLLSVRRLRALGRDEEDARLTDAALAWVGRQRPRARLRAEGAPTDGLTPLFRRGGPIRRPDPDFARAGYRRSQLKPSHKSRPPDPLAPINLAFRLRQILGVGVRAEVIRLLLTSDAARMTANALAQTAGYSKRNVHEALTSLAQAQVIETLAVGSEQRYCTHPELWLGLLTPAGGGFPPSRDWPLLFGALRRILRWLHGAQAGSHSAYITTSHIRDLLDSLRPDLAHAGLSVPRGVDPATAWQDLTETSNLSLSALGLPPLTSASVPRA